MKVIASLRSSRLFPSASGLLLAAALSASSARAADYHVDFSNSLAGNQPVSYVGWNSTLGSGATSISGSTASPGTFISNAVGTTGTTAGFLAMLNQSGTAQILTAYQTGLNLPSAGAITVNLHTSNNTSFSTVRLMVQVAGSTDWYATSVELTPGYNFGAAFNVTPLNVVQKSFTFTTDASAWLDLSFTAGTSISLGAVRSTPLPSGTITGIGFYLNTPSSGTVTRIDDLNIAYTPAPVPEPGTYALLAGGLVGAIVLLRRRRA